MEGQSIKLGTRTLELGRWESWWRSAIPTIVITISLAASFYGHALLRDRAEDRTLAELRLVTAGLADGMQDRTSRAEYFLEAVAAFFEASQSVTAEEFASFTSIVHNSANTSGIDLIAFVSGPELQAGRYGTTNLMAFNQEAAASMPELETMPAWRATIDLAMRTNRLAVSPLQVLGKGSKRSVVLARRAKANDIPERLTGILVLVVDITRITSEAYYPVRDKLGIRLLTNVDDAGPAAEERNTDRARAEYLHAAEDMILFSTPWRLETWNFATTELSGDALLAKGALSLGIFISLILFFATLAQKRARIAADGARRQLLNALESMNDAFAVYDAKDRLAAWNSKYLKNFPRSAGHITLDQRYEEILRTAVKLGEYPDCPEDSEPWIQRRLEAHRKAGTRLEKRLSDGRWLRVSEFRTSEGGVAVLHSDITEAKRHEKLLTTQLATLERMTRGGRLTELLRDVIRWVESNIPGAMSSIHRLDASGRRFTSTLSDSLPKAYTDALDGLEIGDNVGSCGTAAYTRKMVISADIASDPHWHGYRHLVDPFNLKACWSAPIIGETGQVHGTLAVYFEVPREAEETDRKMLGVAATLARLALEREAYLGRLTSLAKMEAVDRLSGGIAHDFNNLLQVIEQSTGLLRDMLQDDKQRMLADLTLEASRKGAALTQRLLVFARGQPLQLGGLDLTIAIRDLEPLLHQALGGDIKLVLDLAEGMPSVSTDRILLESALLNLAINARDAMPSGGQLVITTARQDFEAIDPVLGLEPGGYVMIRIRDNGCGMDAETLRNAIVPYFTTKSVGRGSGLGLSMVYGFTRENGGALLLQSQPGEGTIVTLYLPLTGA